MASVNLKYLMAFWLGFGLALLVTGCVSHSAVRKSGSDQLPLGLYKVVERDCSYSPNMPEDCSQTQYLELVKGAFPSLAKDEVAFVTWMSESPDQEHVFTMRDLRNGTFKGPKIFVVEDDSLGKEWFVVGEGEITDYFFVRYPRRTPTGDMAGSSHLLLRHIRRTDKINRLLQYPATEE